MTEIKYTHKNGRYELVLDGHAGDRVVCSALSAISYLLTAVLQKETAKGSFRILNADEKPGYVFVEAVPYQNSAPRVSLIFDLIIDGYKALAEAYPNNITFKSI